MIRVLHMIGSLNVGGSQTMLLNIYRNIDREEIQFDFVLDHPDQLYFAEEVKKLGGIIYTMPNFNGRNAGEIKRAWDKFFTEHPEYKILHSHVRSYASLYLPIAKKHGVKTIIHSHSTSNGSGISSFVKRVMQYPLRNQADYLFSCSTEAGKWLFGEKALKSDRYHLLQNAVDTDLYKYNEETRQRVREELGLSGRVFIHVGRMHAAKNHAFLLELFSRWLEEAPNDTLVLVGDGDIRKEIEQKIHDLGIEKSVLMLGNRNDVPELLIAADAFLFPSNWEGLPVTVVEAQAAGLPCLVSANVTDDVFISDLAVKLPIDRGTEVWIEEMRKLDYARQNVSEAIIASGFDIHHTAAWISEFYRGLVNE